MNEGITKTDYGVSTETPVPGMSKNATADQDFTLREEAVPHVVDGYKLIDEIGRGGMGLVYRARDLAFDREIALKFLQKKYASNSLHTLRFLDEAQITGQLQHPGIPAVHRVGKLPDGRPYLAMKLIKGYTLSELLWGKNQKSTRSSAPHVIPPNYLSTFEAICQAVGYAHAHQVIHRDLKPQNIMVGAFGEVQVMDWGLAKVLKQQDTADTNVTMDPHATPTMTAYSQIHTWGSELTVAGSVLGTPSYMPPEQAIGANTQLDARSDVFGLGGILCTLLTGRPPFQGENSESTRLLSARGMLSETFALLDGCGVEQELISLAKRCLAPRREDRPPHGGAVAQEVARLRTAADERARLAELERAKAQVQADEQQRRRYVLLFSGAVIIGVLLLGVIGTTWGLFRAAAKREEATKAAQQEHDAQVSEKAQRVKAVEKEQETKDVLSFVEDKVIAAARPQGWESGQGRYVTVQQALILALKEFTKEFNEKPLIEARIRRTLGNSFLFLGDYNNALEQNERAHQIYSTQLGADDRDTLLTVLLIANVKDQMERIDDALTLREKTFNLSKNRYGLDDQLTLTAMSNLADSYQGRGDYQKVYNLREDAYLRARQTLGETNIFTLSCLSSFAQSHMDVDKPKTALDMFETAWTLQKKHLGPTHPYTLETMSHYAASLRKLGKHDLALPLFVMIYQLRQVKFGEDHLATLSAMTQLAHGYSSAGKKEESLHLHKKALPYYEKQCGQSHEDTLNCLWSTAALLFDLKRSEEAIPLIDLCLKRANQPGVNPRLLQAMYQLRYKHFQLKHDLVACQETLSRWENRSIAIVDNNVALAAAWSSMVAAKRETDKSSGSNEAGKAMDYLQKAQQAGWRDASYLENTKDFDPIRSREDFRLLLSKLKEMAK